MKHFLLLILFLLPVLAPAQNFVCNTDVNLYGSASTLTPVRGSVDKGEEVTAQRLQYNGWCYITSKGGKEGYMKIKRLDPLDEIAAEMRTLADKRVNTERAMVTWTAIIALATLILYLLLKVAKSKLRLPVVVIGVLALGVIELLYFMNGYQLTFFSPFVVGGWKWAIIYFIPYVLFIVLQVFLWLSALLDINRISERKEGQGGCAISIFTLMAAFAAIFLMIILNKEAEWKKYIIWGLVITQVIQAVIFFIYYRKTPILALVYIAVWLIGLAAIIYTAFDAIAAVLIALLIVPVMAQIVGVATTFQRFINIGGGKTRAEWTDINS